jgi:hypothetical protein
VKKRVTDFEEKFIASSAVHSGASVSPDISRLKAALEYLKC